MFPKCHFPVATSQDWLLINLEMGTWGRGIKRIVRVNTVNIWVVSLVERCEVPLRAYSQGKRKDTLGINILLPGFELTNASPVLIR